MRSIETNTEILNTADYIVTLRPRIKTLLSDVRAKELIDNDEIKLREYAKLIVKIGANVQKGQVVRLQVGVDQVPIIKNL